MMTQAVFDAGRAILEDLLDTTTYPARFDVTETQPLKAAGLSPDTRLLTFELDGVLHAVPMPVVLSYNVIQGDGWMMTFCNACNTGMVFNPTVDGVTLHFQRRGSYDGLMLIWDEETRSYWQHITGECLYGASVGKQLQSLTTTRQMTLNEAQEKDALLISTPLSPAQQKLSRFTEKMRANPELTEAGIMSTVGQEDTRRPRFELGLGVWDGQHSVFFPLTLLHTHNNALITRFENRPLLIYQMPDAISPVAAYLETESVRWEGDVLRLDSGATIQQDLLVMPDGTTHTLDCPNQLLMRWYGFALTFPGCTLPAGMPDRM
jgi:hypothetical protein